MKNNKGQFKTKHGGWTKYRSTYESWTSMKRRCLVPSNDHYHLYGGRGITICDRWVNDFAAFLLDLGPRPEGMTLDRKNSDGNYEPTNCRWATRAQQNRNRKTIRLITFNGETLCLTDWANRLGVTRPTISDRLKQKWPIEKALTLPPMPGFALEERVNKKGAKP